MEIRPVKFAELRNADTWSLLQMEYEQECALPELGATNPQPNLYALMEKNGMQCFGVYEEGTLIGYATVIVFVVPHYAKKIAQTESIFISPSYRGEGVGIKLMEFLENYAIQKGCKAFQYSAPAGSRFSKMLALNCDRYRLSNKIYLRAL